MSLPRYLEYQDSGVEWLGELPRHWHVAPLKRGFEVCLGKMLQTEATTPRDLLLPYLRAANIQWTGVNTSDIKTMWFSERDRSQLRLEIGDLLVSDGGDVGRSAIWRGEIDECYIQNSVNRVRAKFNGSTRFLYYWMATIKNKGYVDVLCNKSTIAHFTAEKVAEVPVPFPPIDEQTAIATFLDRETAKIDGLIAEQEKLIALLAEKRQATISHAVTKGLNPDAPMKDSGVACLGEVPAHWDVLPLKRLLDSVKAGPFGSALTKEMYVASGYRVYGQEQVIPADFSIGDYYIDHNKFAELQQYSVKADDVLISCVGTFGKIAIVPKQVEPGIINPRLIRLRVGPQLSSRYLEIVLRSSVVFEQFSIMSRGGTMDVISIGTLSAVTLPIPTAHEQDDVLALIDKETGKLDALTAEATRGIALLKERRSALISAAVTGKIDVRHLVETEAA